MQLFLEIYAFLAVVLRGFIITAQSLTLGGSAFLLLAAPQAAGRRARDLSWRLLFWSAALLFLCEALAAAEAVKRPKKSKRPAAEKSTKKIDPRLTAMSRELRDQWTERAEAIVTESVGKHDVKRIAQQSKMASAVTAIGTNAEPLRLEQAA